MRDQEIIQYPGFRNIYDDAGNAIGFEFRIRSNYYRGVYLSLLNVGRVTVDDRDGELAVALEQCPRRPAAADSPRLLHP